MSFDSRTNVMKNGGVMRILAAADLHGNLDIYGYLVRAAAEVNPDVLVLAGDLLDAFGAPGYLQGSQRANARDILRILNRVHQPVLYLMGNDDAVELEPETNSIQSIHRVRVEIGGFNFVGYQYSLPFMGGIFEKPEDGIREDLRSLIALVDDRTVLVTHCPAYGILDVGMLGLRAGSKSILELVKNRNPQLHIHGHIHEEFGVQGRHFNVAAAGHKRAVLIEADTLEHQVLHGD